MSEAVVEIEIGPCHLCGRTPEQGASAGRLDELTISEGVLHGRVTCQECMDEA